MEEGEVCVSCQGSCEKCFVNNNIYVCFKDVPNNYFDCCLNETKFNTDMNEVVLCINSCFFE